MTFHHTHIQQQYWTLNKATIMGWVADGYYARSLHHVSVEGEEGRRLDTTEFVQTATDELQFPGFTFRGYAILQFSSAERVSISLPTIISVCLSQ